MIFLIVAVEMKSAASGENAPDAKRTQLSNMYKYMKVRM